jgi:15-cis-phytoene synthase
MNAALSAYCSEAIGRGSQSFAKATRLFPAETRESVIMLYAWCRHCDDVIDNQRDGKNLSTPSAATIGGRLEELRELTLQALQGAPQGLPFVALHQVCRQHGIPPRLPLDLLQGFEMDATACTYETIEDTLLYCYHVAGVVGVMMACVMGVREESTLQRACWKMQQQGGATCRNPGLRRQGYAARLTPPLKSASRWLPWPAG